MFRIIPLLCALLISSSLCAESFTGKVVGISDGDTIKVLKAGEAVTVRLYGIDAPEDGQDYSNKAKQALSALVFGQTVTVEAKETDLYKRTIGRIRLQDGRSVNEELVSQGYAWWYQEYARKDPKLRELEALAKSAKRGLWAAQSPVPPWEYRGTGKKKASMGVGAYAGAVRGNRNSRIYHWAGCPGYEKIGVKNRVEFSSKDNAEKAGYRRAKNCR